MALGLGACAKNEDATPSSARTVVVSDPHDYQLQVGRAAWGADVAIEMTLICDFGLSTEATYGQTYTISDTYQNAFGNPIVGCNGAENVTMTVKNLSTYPIVYLSYLDGVLFHNNLMLAAGQTFTYQRGF